MSEITLFYKFYFKNVSQRKYLHKFTIIIDKDFPTNMITFCAISYKTLF